MCQLGLVVDTAPAKEVGYARLLRLDRHGLGRHVGGRLLAPWVHRHSPGPEMITITLPQLIMQCEYFSRVSLHATQSYMEELGCLTLMTHDRQKSQLQGLQIDRQEEESLDIRVCVCVCVFKCKVRARVCIRAYGGALSAVRVQCNYLGLWP